MYHARLALGLASIIAVVILACLLDRSAIMSALSGVSAVEVIVGLLIVQCQIVISAIRWRSTARRLGQTISLRHAIGEYYLASALNQILPGGVAGDVSRAYRGRTAGEGGWQASAKAVAIERLSGQMAFFVVCVAGLAFWPLLLDQAVPPGVLPMLILAFVMVCIVLILAIRRLKSLGAVLRQALVADGAWRVQASLSLAAVLSYIALFFLSSDATGGPLPIAAAFTIVPLCLLVMLIPTGFGGWGTREAAAASLWPLMGYASAQGVAASILYGALALVGALPGLFVLLSVSRRRSSTLHDSNRA